MTREEVIAEREAARTKVRELINNGATVTLNGNPATISGFQLDFARVSSKGLSAEWSWSAVEHTITKHKGKFTSE